MVESFCLGILVKSEADGRWVNFGAVLLCGFGYVDAVGTDTRIL